MPVERHFVGWDAPVTAKVREFLLPPQLSGPVDLGNLLLVVPTRQAGRRLREALARHCAEQNTALLSPRVVTPAFLLHSEDEPANVANQTEVAAVWADVLMRADLTQYSGLFPAGTPEQDFAWAIHTGEMIQRLRDTLVDGGHCIADVHQQFGSVLEEPERWRDLAELETAYLERLRELGRQDPSELMIKRSERPELPEGTERIVVAAVPDPTPLMIPALEHLAEQVSVVILVHAPESVADHFDNWGRPVAGKWRESPIDIPDAEANVVLAGSPVSQSRKVVEAIAGEAGRFGPDDIAIGVPDRGVIPFLAADLADNGLLAFDPAGKAVGEHPLYHLLEALRALVNEGTYAAFSAFLRHADVLDFLRKKHNLPPRRVLQQLDSFQNRHLPLGLDDITSRFSHQASKPEEEPGEFGDLGKAVEFIQDQVQTFENNDLDSAVRSLLRAVYEVRLVNPSSPEGEEFIAVADLIHSTLRELAGGVVSALHMEKKDALELLLRRLSKEHYYSERAVAAIDLEGWLELPWDDAPFLIVTGMNDGSVPDSRLSDVFLPDSLRGRLSLRHDADWLARDAYLMRTMIESRREEGRVCFIAGKTSAEGEPLKPSRLLFRCGDEQLPRRAERLFGSPEEKRDNHPATISFLLEAGPRADLTADRLDLQRMPVTWFGDYLACPFRFYLRHVLGMEELDDEKREMDALDFGSLVHYVLQRMAESEDMRHCENEGELRHFLCAEAEDWTVKRFGPSPSLQVVIQLEAARQRLGAAARVQAGLVRKGWEILRSEMVIEAKLAGMFVRGRIDRIDRHRETGRVRVIDYKTSDKVQSPEEAHIASLSEDAVEYARVKINGKEKRWIDLQMPLYIILLQDKDEFRAQIELGYFNLPKAVNDTGVTLWEGFDDELLGSARACAEGVLRDIRNRRFWPPAAKVAYDDFGSLFYADVAECVNVETIEAFME